jgi:uncharacterized PurR-regulated membrane protein YhhQ (DUF165 family)
VTVAFVTVLLCANLIGPAKVAKLGPVTFGAGVLFFPISYIFGDVLTEVYGYAGHVASSGRGSPPWPSPRSWPRWCWPSLPRRAGRTRPPYETVFGSTWRIVLASLVAFWAGEFCNSYVLARMKVKTSGGGSSRAPSAPRSWARGWTP